MLYSCPTPTSNRCTSCGDEREGDKFQLSHWRALHDYEHWLSWEPRAEVPTENKVDEAARLLGWPGKDYEAQ